MVWKHFEVKGDFRIVAPDGNTVGIRENTTQTEVHEEMKSMTETGGDMAGGTLMCYPNERSVEPYEPVCVAQDGRAVSPGLVKPPLPF